MPVCIKENRVFILKIQDIKHILAKRLVLATSSIVRVSYTAKSAPPRTQIRQCADTSIQGIGDRLRDSSTGKSIPDSLEQGFSKHPHQGIVTSKLSPVFL